MTEFIWKIHSMEEKCCAKTKAKLHTGNQATQGKCYSFRRYLRPLQLQPRNGTGTSQGWHHYRTHLVRKGRSPLNNNPKNWGWSNWDGSSGGKAEMDKKPHHQRELHTALPQQTEMLTACSYVLKHMKYQFVTITRNRFPSLPTHYPVLSQKDSRVSS